jgi:hypothetical protein
VPGDIPANVNSAAAGKTGESGDCVPARSQERDVADERSFEFHDCCHASWAHDLAIDSAIIDARSHPRPRNPSCGCYVAHALHEGARARLDGGPSQPNRGIREDQPGHRMQNRKAKWNRRRSGWRVQESVRARRSDHAGGHRRRSWGCVAVGPDGVGPGASGAPSSESGRGGGASPRRSNRRARAGARRAAGQRLFVLAADFVEPFGAGPSSFDDDARGPRAGLGSFIPTGLVGTGWRCAVSPSTFVRRRSFVCRCAFVTSRWKCGVRAADRHTGRGSCD